MATTDSLKNLQEKVARVSKESSVQSNEMLGKDRLSESQFEDFNKGVLNLSALGHLFTMFFLITKELPTTVQDLIHMSKTKEPASQENVKYFHEQEKKLNEEVEKFFESEQFVKFALMRISN